MSPSAAPATIERLGPDVVADPVAEPEGAPEPSAVVDEPAGLAEAKALLRFVFGRRELDLSGPTPARLALGSLGFATSFGAAALSLPLEHAPSVAAAGLVAALGTAILTGPALLILHQFLGLLARPIDLLAALSRGFADAGQIALGVTPFLLLLSLTSRLGLPALLVCCAGLGGLTLALTHRRLIRLESRHPDAGLRQQLLMFALATAWGGLAALISGRLALGLLLPAITS